MNRASRPFLSTAASSHAFQYLARAATAAGADVASGKAVKNAMCEFIKTYQTLVVGLLGFLGVMATLWWNGHLQRKQEERQKRREASALRKALIEELKQQRAALQETADSLAAAQASTQDGTHGSLIPLERFDAVFRRSLERLGLLERRELSAVFEAYLPLPRLTWRLRRLEELERLNAEPSGRTFFEPKEDHISLTRKNYKTASEMHVQIVPAIDAAIAELERNMG
jgi:hypothetical protein